MDWMANYLLCTHENDILVWENNSYGSHLLTWINFDLSTDK